MPNGNVHNAATIALGAATIPIAFLTQPTETALLYTGGVVLGIFMTPDLDQSEIHAVTPQEMVGNILGEIPEYIWRFIWYPYGMLIKHRSWMSHLPIIGTVLRLAYLYGWYLFVMWMFRLDVVWYQPPLALVVGLCGADTLHFILDQLPFFRENKKPTRRTKWAN